MKSLLRTLAELLFAAILSTSAFPQKTLPIPPEKFQGKIEVKATDSTPFFPSAAMPPAGAPNILLVMLDDVGFGAAGTFGGLVNTPTLDKVASSGLIYTYFHTTSMCSPTRAALAGGGGIVTLLVDGIEVTHDEITSTTPVEYTLDEGMDVGEDSGTPVNLDYDVPFRFTGVLKKVTIDLKLDQPSISAAEQKKVDRTRRAMALRD